MQENRQLSPLQISELKKFINENSSYIYEYINKEVLKDIGNINAKYFEKILEDIFKENIEENKYTTNKYLLPYFIFTLLPRKARVDYTSLRTETIDFSKINKEAAKYYNYAQFSLKDDFFIVELKQSKIGGMPIDDDIVKFSKKVQVKDFGLEEFIKSCK